MTLIDIGVNLTNKRLISDLQAILNRATENGVEQMIVTGTSVEHSRLAIQLCEQFPEQLFSTCGIHPHDARHWSADSMSELEEMVIHNCVKAVGETGLDFNRNFSPQPVQVEVFQHQLEFAIAHGKPVFLHQRDAFDTFYTLLKEYRHQIKDVVVHCFTDNKKALFSLLDLDCHIGITGWICDERRGRELQTLVSSIPADRLMLETDAPYLLPRDLPHAPGGNLNLPEYLPHILHTVARCQQKPPEQLAAETLTTTRRFFDI